VNIEHVSGACQLFRRECFEEIGGYRPVNGGGIDYIAVVSSRMKGWKTRTFTERTFHHNRQMGTAQYSPLKAKFKLGVKDYALGNHLVWELFRATYQLSKSPIVIGSIVLLCGYMWELIRLRERSVSPEMAAFTSHEQMQRLKSFLTQRRTSQHMT
jgi:hypothetical protein